MTKHPTPPWIRPAKSKSAREHLSPAKKRAAKARAARAGRPYPNLIDNMQAARKPAARRKSRARRSAK
jgi:hypothetical protein